MIALSPSAGALIALVLLLCEGALAQRETTRGTNEMTWTVSDVCALRWHGEVSSAEANGAGGVRVPLALRCARRG